MGRTITAGVVAGLSVLRAAAIFATRDWAQFDGLVIVAAATILTFLCNTLLTFQQRLRRRRNSQISTVNQNSTHIKSYFLKCSIGTIFPLRPHQPPL